MADKEMIYGIDKVQDNKFGKKASIFLGWYTTPSDEGDYYSELVPVSIPAENGETIYITDLPAGTTYEIEEVYIPDGWALVDGKKYTGQIKPNVASKYPFVNKYSASGTADITMYKQLIGATLTPGAFKFELSANSEFAEVLQHELKYSSKDAKHSAPEIEIPGAKRLGDFELGYNIEGAGTVTVCDAEGNKLGE